jgi:peptidoglycan/xylan/chitin deacetylase (PgdA/CDA1 family)
VPLPSRLKNALLGVATHPAVLRLTGPLTRDVVPVFTMHRFATSRGPDPDQRDPETLRRRLEEVSHLGFVPIALHDAIKRLAAGERVERAVVFTVDDGYADFATLGAPVFASAGCPVTVFVVTGFLDGTMWLWWDQLEFVMEHTALRVVELETDGRVRRWSWVKGAEFETLVSVAEALKLVPDASRVAAVRSISEQCRVEIPQRPPPRYAPMTWDQVRVWSQRGVTFGPHSITHPILSRLSDAEAEKEIAGSWRRLREATDAAIPVFCYPNGQPADFGDREYAILQRAGLEAAVSTSHGFVTARLFGGDAAVRFALPRFPCPEDRAHFWQVLGGIQRIRNVYDRSLSSSAPA